MDSAGSVAAAYVGVFHVDRFTPRFTAGRKDAASATNCCGDVEAGDGGAMVWISCDCGASMAALGGKVGVEQGQAALNTRE